MTLPSTSVSTAPACALFLATTAGLLLGASPAGAQEVGAQLPPRQTVSIVPRVSLTETATSNVQLTSAGNSDVVTELSPGIRINIEGAKLKAFVDYAVSEVAYARTPASRRVLNALNSYGTLEAVDNWAFIDFSGAIGQQAISAFGQQSSDPVLINANQTEVATFHVSPYVRGRWGELATYEARYSRSLTHRSGNGGSNDDTVDTVAKIAGIRGDVGLGWSVDAGRQAVNYSGGRSTDSDHVNLALPYAITPQIKVSVNGGRESNNYASISKQAHGIAGFGFAWSPSALSSLTASREQHSYGDAHVVSFDSRTARTAWRFSDVKDVATTPGLTSSASRGSVYDLLFSQFATLQPDPVARAQLVNAYLQSNGMAPNVVVTSGFLTSSLSLQRRQDFSFALLGVRDTVTFLTSRSQTRNLDALAVAVGDLANAAVVQQRGFSVNLAHRLTPDYSLGLLMSEQLSSSSLGGQNGRQRSLVGNLAGKLSGKALLTLGLRHTIADRGFSYAETAVTGNLSVSF